MPVLSHTWRGPGPRDHMEPATPARPRALQRPRAIDRTAHPL